MNPPVSRRQVLATAGALAVAGGASAAAGLASTTSGAAPHGGGGGAADSAVRSAARDITRSAEDGTILTPTYLQLLTDDVHIEPRGQRIAIVGAGMAGLAAAYILQKAGHQVRVIDAHPDRIGGRVQTLRDWHHPAAYAEAGALRIPGTHTLVTGLARHLGVGLRPFVRDDESRILHVNGAMASRAQYRRHPRTLNKTFDVTDDRTASAMLDDALEPVRAMVKGDSTDGWARFLDQYDSWSLQRFLTDRAGLTAGELDLLDTLESGTARLPLSLTHALLTTTALPPDTRQWEIPGGMDHLPKALADKLDEGTLRPGWRLTGVDSRPAKLRLAVEKTGTGRPENLEADRVIITAPFPALRYVTFTPDLSYGKRRAMQELRHGAATNVLLEFDQRWWGTDGGADLSDTPLRRTVYPSHPSGDGGVVLASATSADDAAVWDSMPGKARAGHALKLMTDLYGEDVERSYTGRWASPSWARNEYACGEAARYAPGQAVELGPHTRTPEADGRLWFAGDQTSTHYRAWIEGALESACRVAYGMGVRPATGRPGK
ncbi:NAD(P)/FAD-dependent oxidoreductase [Streptomyces sp. NPDC000151]|uniref:flavin monoamine oxidase family protein n=1 Tax=Streptomyces sp. NPDC000151 TaxID=3154244 RepID=UPI00331BB6CC